MDKNLNLNGMAIAAAFLAGWTLPKVIAYLSPSTTTTTKRNGRNPSSGGSAREEEKDGGVGHVAGGGGMETKARRRGLARAALGRGDWIGKSLKLVLCVRTDIKMKKGKMCAQCGHAVAGIMEDLLTYDAELLQQWTNNAQPKIALKVRSEEELRELQAAARRVHLPSHLVMDAGRTQIAAGSLTVLAIGPGPIELIDSITGQLKLL
eukprot:CAMPEP_0167783404 /NCGR_PEP_ID=MMETSP0111_2-20121227/7051_1 /TAXON_ID=91324 /ORGANISM="Lotharella globosa, Strain CCCM811" /LENGTH=206 /DNA_ID=CAMNT_0007674337 /DNA_START=32 /DNA_END=652 /DNA_ORIENTATION=-